MQSVGSGNRGVYKHHSIMNDALSNASLLFNCLSRWYPRKTSLRSLSAINCNVRYVAPSLVLITFQWAQIYRVGNVRKFLIFSISPCRTKIEYAPVKEAYISISASVHAVFGGSLQHPPANSSIDL